MQLPGISLPETPKNFNSSIGNNTLSHLLCGLHIKLPINVGRGYLLGMIKARLLIARVRIGMQKAAASVNCPDSPTATNTAICQDLDTIIQLKDITCCGICSATSKGLTKGDKAGIGVGAVLGGLLLILVIAFTLHKLCRRASKREPPPRTSAVGNKDAPANG